MEEGGQKSSGVNLKLTHSGTTRDQRTMHCSEGVSVYVCPHYPLPTVKAQCKKLLFLFVLQICYYLIISGKFPGRKTCSLVPSMGQMGTNVLKKFF